MARPKFVNHDTILNRLQSSVVSINDFFDLATGSGLFCNKNFSFDVNCHHSQSGATPLLISCRRQSLNVPLAKLLISMGADPNQPDKKYNVPLYEAIVSDNLELVELLVAHGAKLHYLGVDYLQLAEDHCHQAIYNYLATKINPDRSELELVFYEESRQQARQIEQQLKCAIEKDNVNEAKKILLNHTVNLSNILFEGEVSLIWFAAVNGNAKLVQLLADYGDKVFATIGDVSIPEAAKSAGHPDIAEFVMGLQEKRYQKLLAVVELTYGADFVDNYFEAQRRARLGFFAKTADSLKHVFAAEKKVSEPNVQRHR